MKRMSRSLLLVGKGDMDLDLLFDSKERNSRAFIKPRICIYCHYICRYSCSMSL